MNFKLIQKLCDLALEFPEARDDIAKMINKHTDIMSYLQRRYNEGIGKLSLIKDYRSVSGETLVDCKKFIERNFTFPNPNENRNV